MILRCNSVSLPFSPVLHIVGGWTETQLRCNSRESGWTRWWDWGTRRSRPSWEQENLNIHNWKMKRNISLTSYILLWNSLLAWDRWKGDQTWGGWGNWPEGHWPGECTLEIIVGFRKAVQRPIQYYIEELQRKYKCLIK